MNDIDEFLEKRCKNDVLRKMKNVFQLQIMRYVIKTHQKMLFGQIFGQKTFFGQKFDNLSQIQSKWLVFLKISTKDAENFQNFCEKIIRVFPRGI